MAATDDPLVSTEWLAAHLGDPDLRVLDAAYRMPAMRPPTAREEYDARHITGARFFDIDAVADTTNPLPHMLPTPSAFERAVGALGIANTDRVVIYDRGDYMGAPRAWWTFRTFGHVAVKVLEGGLKRWLTQDRPVTADASAVAPSVFHARYEGKRVRGRDDIGANIESRREQVIDARAADRFEGRAPEPWPGRRSGHIPNSRNVPFTALYDADTGLLKPDDELRLIFVAAGIDLHRPIVATCGSGVTAGAITVALQRLGVRDTAVYDGSWAEWGLPDGPPVATGPA